MALGSAQVETERTEDFDRGFPLVGGDEQDVAGRGFQKLLDSLLFGLVEELGNR